MLPRPSAPGIPRSFRCAHSRPLTLKRRGRGGLRRGVDSCLWRNDGGGRGDDGVGAWCEGIEQKGTLPLWNREGASARRFYPPGGYVINYSKEWGGWREIRSKILDASSRNHLGF